VVLPCVVVQFNETVMRSHVKDNDTSHCDLMCR